MDMKRIRGQTSSTADQEAGGGATTEEAAAAAEKRPSHRILRPAVLLVVCLLALPLFVVISRVHRSHAAADIAGREIRIEQGLDEFKKNLLDVVDDSVESPDAPKDRLLGGLLVSGFDESSCLSRYQSALYRKSSPHIPSSYLLARLRKYEVLHKRCGPYTDMYNKTIDQMKSVHSSGSTECNYVVWVSYSGLGNRILTMASAFLYALLSNRVLLVDRGADMSDLFCEPFPETSWFLPSDFPLKQFSSLNLMSPESYGNMLKNKVISNNGNKSLPAHLYLYLAHDYGDFDKLFFCDEDQLLLERIPWLVMKTDNYFVPSLFLMPKYEEELSKLFPERDSVFHHLGRYLFHPTNSVWGLITRYYQAYLAKADERVGFQIRIFEQGPGPFQYVQDQILACALNEKLLPGTTSTRKPLISTTDARSKAVLITCLVSGYFEKLKSMYWEQPTANGEIIGFYQPSNEVHQQTQNHMHNMKALAEMYLLSLTDVLVTSSWSTFGYVAQGLGGLTPWILVKSENQTTPVPACRRAMSMEPCFHSPPLYDCKAKRGTDTGALVPHVRHCEDMSWGLKLVNQHEW